ncbi:MAG: type I phosphomannose isomerase catalytic subunit [Pirellulales bacterium]
MAELYPLRFQPVYRRYIWGGDRLRTVLGKNTGDEMYAESWEVVDHGDDQSVVLAGPLAGVSLGELVREHGAALLGRHHPQPRFPLLAKFLDAHRTLSVQVHPNDAQAARLDPPDLGKTEAWLVMDVEPGSVVYAGLKQGFDRPSFEREMKRGTAELCLNSFEPAVGQCVFIPAGLVHALGEGLLIFEIQQSSDTTYRLFDWNRLQADGTRASCTSKPDSTPPIFHSVRLALSSPSRPTHLAVLVWSSATSSCSIDTSSPPRPKATPRSALVAMTASICSQ